MDKYYAEEYPNHYNLRFGNPDSSNSHVAFLTNISHDDMSRIVDSLNAQQPKVTQNKRNNMARAKYIIVEKHGIEVPIVFCPILSHDRVAGIRKVFGAGFCVIDDLNKWNVWGESISLKVKSRPEDAEILNRLLCYNC